MFKLEHPFKRAATANDFAEGDLRDNLMEYYGGKNLVKLQWDAIHHPGTVIGIFERDEDAMQKDDPYYEQVILKPNSKYTRVHKEAIGLLNDNKQVIAFILPDETVFVWLDESGKYGGHNRGYFKDGDPSKGIRSTYGGYVEDKYNRKSEPISWGMNLAAKDMGDFIISMVDKPVETTKNVGKGLWMIVTLDFDIEKTWDRIISADVTDISHVSSFIALAYLSGPSKLGVIGSNDFAKFAKFIQENSKLIKTSKLSWNNVLLYFKGRNVWNYIKATQEVYPGSILPKSFELTTSVSKVWIHPNATKHITEYIQLKAINFTPEYVRLVTQIELQSLHAAVESALKLGVKYDSMMNIGGWELIFSAPRKAGDLPVLKHALIK